jgi:predicted GNAT superfamily acetyltransferase
VPLTILVAGKEAGGVLVGAYDGSALVGFAFGFPGHEHGEATHHSHMLAVSLTIEPLIGFKLKVAQRDRVREQDHLDFRSDCKAVQCLFYFNFAKLE